MEPVGCYISHISFMLVVNSNENNMVSHWPMQTKPCSSKEWGNKTFLINVYVEVAML